MKLSVLSLALSVITLIVLTGCRGAFAAPEGIPAAESVNTTSQAVDTPPVLIMSAANVPGIGQASFTKGYPVVGLYEARPLPNGQVAVKLTGKACRLSSTSDAITKALPEVAARTVTSEPVIITSAGYVSGIGQASLSPGNPVVGVYEMRPLPNGQVAIEFSHGSCES